MDLATAIFATCAVLYVLSGHRTSLLAAAVIAFLFSHRKTASVPPGTPTTEVDFTHSFPPGEKCLTPSKAPVTTLARKVVSHRGRSPKLFSGTKRGALSLTQSTIRLVDSPMYIFYTTLTGMSKCVAEMLRDRVCALESRTATTTLLSLDDDVDDLEEYFMKVPQKDHAPLYVMVLPSYETDSPIDYFLEHLQDTYQDFRVDKYPLRGLCGFAVLGLGDSESWNGNLFCYQARLADRWLAKLGARRLFPVGQNCVKHHGLARATEWMDRFVALLEDKEPFYLDDSVDDSDAEEVADSSEDVVDVEDMGRVIAAAGGKISSSEGLKQMVAQDSPTYRSLTKQGYTIVGLHLGVKICRWTKSALRGRGSCYKYAFYGIRSHLCMETTPSLACSNKCVFCWRHGTNPVAKLNWRWEVDPPETVLKGALAGHYLKIKQMRGVPGIQMERFEEAFQVRHCALSLVGEPIFYPHINEFLGMLHERLISSFLVCNAQHPDHLARLNRVTQLYVSIDAPTKTDLKKVDRPLNLDFWERLMACLDILRTTQAHQRTVFRLTLVKGFNMGDIASYADMVERAQPSQIEVKGATFCGSSNTNANPLTMQNIPFYDECKIFVEQLVTELQARGQRYALAAEHAHSCCILIAHERFRIDGEWHTHIDYERFFELLDAGVPFGDMDYIRKTPAWAVWGSEEAGFSPDDTRYDRKAEKLRKRLEREERGDEQ